MLEFEVLISRGCVLALGNAEDCFEEKAVCEFHVAAKPDATELFMRIGKTLACGVGAVDVADLVLSHSE